jgi:hypothetical protein
MVCDDDLKKMNPSLASHLTYFLLKEAFGITEEILNLNYDENLVNMAVQLRQKVAERAEHSVQFVNMNLMFYKGLARLNQHVSFDFEFLLNPQDYGREWK